MGTTIRKMAVIGAGTMGAAIAACGARAGLDVVLLVRGKGEVSGRERARTAVETIVKKGEMAGSCPERILSAVVPADMEADAGLLADCDLVIEAVAENLKVKADTMHYIFENCADTAVVGTNTSNISIADIAAGFPADWCCRFMGIHFFNPVRYMDLVELIPHMLTDDDNVKKVYELITNKFGKTPVLCKDTPGFIANRIGSMALTSAMNAVTDAGYTFAEADALTGDLIFRPKQGAFRLLDMVGLDICEHTTDYMSTADVPDFEKIFRNRPAVLKDLYDQGFLGDKTGSGFYKKEKTPAGTKRLMWDYNNREYVPYDRVKVASIEGLPKKERLGALLSGSLPESDFVRRVFIEPIWLAMMVADDISFDYKDIDTAMRGGYNWVKGPFEQCDAIGPENVFALMRKCGLKPPEWATKLIAEQGKFYAGGAVRSPYLQVRDFAEKVIMENADAKLVDTGNGIACFTLKTKANTYTIAAAEMMLQSVKEVEKSDAFRGMVIAYEGPNFGAGANLMDVAGAITTGQFDTLEKGVQALQEANLAIKYLKKPVVAAVSGQALGGSAEVMLHAGKVMAHQELYAGLVEVGVGLVPSGGGCAELLMRATRGLEYGQMARIITALDEIVLPIAQAKFSMSAEEAFKNGYLRHGDVIVPKCASLFERARQQAIVLADCGYRAPHHMPITAAGESGYTHLMATVHVMLSGKFMTPYDAVIIEKLARIFTGGDALAGEKVSEEDIIALERKYFMELCHNEKTLERIKGMLETGKPVRN